MLPHVVMLTNTTPISSSINWLAQPLPLPSLLLLLLLLAPHSHGSSVTWGQVNKYASTLYVQDVYLTRVDSTAESAFAKATTDVTDVLDVVYKPQNTSLADGYTITAVHAYDMTPEAVNGGDGGTAQLLSGGVGQQQAVVRLQRHKAVDLLLPIVHFQLVIYGVNL